MHDRKVGIADIENQGIKRPFMDELTTPFEGKIEKQTRFIELRASGKSYADIAGELGVSKGTLTSWSRDLGEKISRLKAERLEGLYEKYSMLKEARITQLGETFKKISEELDRRDFSDIPTEKLLDMKVKYLRELQEEKGGPLEDGADPKLNAEGILEALLGLRARLKAGDISKEQANREGSILLTTLRAYQALILEAKLDTLSAKAVR